jgi:hypothetical protein
MTKRTYTLAQIENWRQIAEVIARSHKNDPVDEQAPLAKKTNNKELLAKLLKLEEEIINRARNKEE